MYNMSIDKSWIVKEQGNPAIVRELSSNLGIGEVLANLLVQRNITSSQAARTFLRPNLNQLHDPFLMKDMDLAVDRLIRALDSGEKILIYGDYDVDGTTAVSLVFSFLSKFQGANLDYYIPDRYSEGYGISYKGIEYAYKNSFSLIVALDCGIKAIEKVEYGASKGVDFIICDHHLPDETLPTACAVLDPKRSDCTYPFKELSGCGVGFKLMQALAIRKGVPEESLFSLLDFVAVSIAADLVPIVGENRVLAYEGLKRLNSNPSKGLLSIIKLSGLEKHDIKIDDIVFKIGPRINAAGRMESGRTAVDLLTTGSDVKAKEIGETINSHNDERKFEDRRITQEAIEMASNMKNFEDLKATVLYNPDWHKGVLGIVASRLVENFYKPAIVLCKSNNLITGSARSIPGFDLYEAIEHCSHLLENFGGHMYAAGLTIKEENFNSFKERFENFVAERITPEDLIPVINVDSFLDFKQITPRFLNILKQFHPFGPGNPSPIFITEKVYDNGNGRKVGADSGHLKLELIQEDHFHRHLSAIAFNRSEHFDHLKEGNPVNVCYSVAENYYRGIANIQLRVIDIKMMEEPI